MYRRLIYSVYRARNRAVEACVLTTKCDIPALTVSRVVNGGVKALSTSPISYCDKKDSLPPKQDGKSSTEVTEMSQQVAAVGAGNSEAVQQMDDTGKLEEQKSNESTSEQSLEVRLEEGKEGEGMMEVGVVQAEADSNIQQMGIISPPEVQESKESTSEERLEVRLEEGKEGEGMMEVGVVQAEADSSIQHMDDMGTPEVQKSNESSSEERLEIIEVRLEENKEGEVMAEVGVIPAEADNTIQHMDDISTPEVQKSKENTSEEKLDVRLEEDTAVLGMVELKNTERKSGSSKSSKESLLDLLGAMKVDVTSKRKFKSMKVPQSSTPTPKPKPAAMESTESMFQKATEEASVQSETLNPELVAAATAAAATLPNRSQAESELLRQLRRHEAVSEAQKKGEVKNLDVIIADMKVGKGPNRQHARPANQIQFDDDGRGYVDDRGITSELNAGVRRRRTLFSGKRLGIFSPTVDKEAETAVARPTLWDIDFTNQIVMSTNQAPRNALEEMIQWTKEGKLWEYPINNEAGLEEEISVPFHEHIFLEKHLKEGFPQQGPVRHFMELVVAGLARNAHLTVQQKKDHISWFRDYFHQKEDVLKEADVYLN